MPRKGAGARRGTGGTEIRYLSAADEPAIAAHLLRLSPEDRRLRFFCAVGDSGIRAHCDELKTARVTLIGAFHDGALVGLGELSRARPRRRLAAELGLSVDEGERRRGDGARLMAAALAIARNRFAGRMVVRYLDANRAMAALARRRGAALRRVDGEIEGVFPAPRPTLGSLAVEAGLILGAWAQALAGLRRALRLRPRPRMKPPGMRAA